MIIEVHNTGKSIKVIYEEDGVSVTTINRWINEIKQKEKNLERNLKD